MKKLILLLILSVIAHSVFAQLEFGYHFKIKNYYKIKPGRNLYPLELNYKVDGINYKKFVSHDIDTYWHFIRKNGCKRANLIAQEDGTIKVEFARYFITPSKDTIDIKGEKYSFIDSSNYVDSFYLSIHNREKIKDITSYRSFPFVMNQIGVIAIPFKYRFGNSILPNNFSSDINAGIYVGRKWGRARFYKDMSKNHESASVTLAFFCGPTIIGITQETIKDSSAYTRDSDELGLSYGGGIMYSYRKFNVGLFAGRDSPVNKIGMEWIYENRFWLGFGLGFSILTGRGDD